MAMKKMKLALDDLAVETFAPAEPPENRGTVHAHDSGPYTDECLSCGVYTGCGFGGCESEYPCGHTEACPTATCVGYWTCEGVYTCAGGTCDYPACTSPEAAC
jgi:hypothetical protein